MLEIIGSHGHDLVATSNRSTCIHHRKNSEAAIQFLKIRSCLKFSHQCKGTYKNIGYCFVSIIENCSIIRFFLRKIQTKLEKINM